MTDDSAILAFLRGLRRDSGGYADLPTGEAGSRSTLSVIKALKELGALGADPELVAFVAACATPGGGFAQQPSGEPAPFDTAQGLIAIRNLGEDEALAKLLEPGLAFMAEHASTQFDHFMLVATYEECGLEQPVPAATLDFFRQRLAASLAEGKVVDSAIAAASLLRAGQALEDPDAVAALALSGQTADGGFGDGGASSLFGTYCALRLLVLLGRPPHIRRLAAYLDSLKTPIAYADHPGGASSAGATYQVLSMGGWLRQLQRIPVAAARAGDVERLRSWLLGGGDPDLYDEEGWTPLLAAASRGQAAAVDLLLNHRLEGAPRATASLRYAAADALPVYLAGQAGDVETVRLLLAAEPSQLHAISSVNGHTVLLQAAFYGKAKHLELAAYLLDHAASISGLPPEQLEAEQDRLLSATNVRGFSPLTMQDLWHNQKMKDLLLRYHGGDPGSARGQRLEKARAAYHQRLLLKIASPQALTERLIGLIARYLESEQPQDLEHGIDSILAQPQFEIDRLGGDLEMPPLVLTLTGTDVGNPSRAQRRHHLARKLLEKGADPAVRERHPMAVGAVIRASVLNNFGLLQLLAEFMTPAAFAAEMNVSPAVNGLTAMHDAIHRALTSPPAELDGHLAQIAWMVDRGARLDLPDNTGQTQRQLAESALSDAAFPRENAERVWRLVGGAVPAGAAATTSGSPG